MAAAREGANAAPSPSSSPVAPTEDLDVNFDGLDDWLGDCLDDKPMHYSMHA